MFKFFLFYISLFTVILPFQAQSSDKIFDPISMNWVSHEAAGSIQSKYRRKKMSCPEEIAQYKEGTIYISQKEKFLYLVQAENKCMRYGIGVGRDGFRWSGKHRVSRKAEWPSWTPPPAMRKRQPDLPTYMEGGINNPLGARALYIGATIYRIHGTNVPTSIGTDVSSGCIRLANHDIEDLYERVKVGARVVVSGNY